MKSNAFRVDFDLSEAFAGLDKIAEAAGKHIRTAAQAGADVFYHEVKYRVPVSEHGHWFYGTNQKYWFDAGTLRDSIYQAFSRDNSVDGVRATYHIAWNHRKAPYGFMVEYGTSRAPAHPFLRPAYEAVKDVALAVSNDKFAELMESVPGVSR